MLLRRAYPRWKAGTAGKSLSTSQSLRKEEESGDGAITAQGLNEVVPEMTYGGVLSFLRRKYSRDLTTKDLDVVVSGIPYDNAVTYRPGARLGPRAIRAASVQLAELKHYPFGVHPQEDLGIIDYGDCFI